MSSQPRPLAHRLAAFGAAGLFSLGVLGATFRDTTRAIVHSSALPMFARVGLGEPGSEWDGADDAREAAEEAGRAGEAAREETRLALEQARFDAERVRAQAELARARAETERVRAANRALLAARTDGEKARKTEPARATGFAYSGQNAWAGSVRFTVPRVLPPRPLSEPVREIVSNRLRSAHVAWASEEAPTQCVVRTVHAAAAAIEADEPRLAALTDRARRLASLGELDAATSHQLDSVARYVAIRIDTAAMRALASGAERASCG